MTRNPIEELELDPYRSGDILNEDTRDLREEIDKARGDEDQINQKNNYDHAEALAKFGARYAGSIVFTLPAQPFIVSLNTILVQAQKNCDLTYRSIFRNLFPFANLRHVSSLESLEKQLPAFINLKANTIRRIESPILIASIVNSLRIEYGLGPIEASIMNTILETSLSAWRGEGYERFRAVYAGNQIAQNDPRNIAAFEANKSRVYGMFFTRNAMYASTIFAAKAWAERIFEYDGYGRRIAQKLGTSEDAVKKAIATSVTALMAGLSVVPDRLATLYASGKNFTEIREEISSAFKNGKTLSEKLKPLFRGILPRAAMMTLGVTAIREGAEFGSGMYQRLANYLNEEFNCPEAEIEERLPRISQALSDPNFFFELLGPDNQRFEALVERVVGLNREAEEIEEKENKHADEVFGKLVAEAEDHAAELRQHRTPPLLSPENTSLQPLTDRMIGWGRGNNENEEIEAKLSKMKTRIPAFQLNSDQSPKQPLSMFRRGFMGGPAMPTMISQRGIDGLKENKLLEELMEKRANQQENSSEKPQQEASKEQQSDVLDNKKNKSHADRVNATKSEGVPNQRTI